MQVIHRADQRQRIVLIFAAFAVVFSTAMMVWLPNPAWILLLFSVPVVMVGMLRLPGAVFAAYLYIPYYKATVDPFLPVDITGLLAAACFALVFAGLLEDRKQEVVSPRSAFWLWTGLLAVIVAGVIYSPNLESAFRQAVSFMFLVYLPGLLALRIGANRDLQRQFLITTIGFSALVVILGLLQLGSIGFYERVTVLGTNTIGTARAAMMLPLIVPALFPRLSVIVRVIMVFLVPSAIVVTVTTGSRGALIMGVVTLAVVYWLLGRNRLRNLGGGLVMGGALVALLQIPALQQLIPVLSVQRITQVFQALIASDATALDASSTIRLQLWEEAERIFVESPAIGSGTGGFHHIVTRIPGFESLGSPHNLFLHFASEFGLVGLMVFVSIVCVAMVRGIRGASDPYSLAFLALGVFAVLSSIVGVELYDGRWLWGYLLILVSLPPVKARSRSTASQRNDGRVKGRRTRRARKMQWSQGLRITSTPLGV